MTKPVGLCHGITILRLPCDDSLQPATLFSLAFYPPTKGVPLQIRYVRTFTLASFFALLLSTGFVLAQDGAKQDLKTAGTDTKNAAKATGQGVATGTKTAADKTASGTKTVADKTADGTKTAYNKTVSGTKTAADKTAEGTKTVGKDIGHGTKVAAKDTAHETEKVGDKVVGKPTPQ
jgi:hypothetical protein